MAGGRSPYEEKVETIAALRAENDKLVEMNDTQDARIAELSRLLKLQLQNGVIHYRDERGTCYRTCVGCGLEKELRAALEEDGEA